MSAEEYERYRGKHVVVYKGRVISEGSSSVEAVKNALKKHYHLKPEDLEVAYVPLRGGAAPMRLVFKCRKERARARVVCRTPVVKVSLKQTVVGTRSPPT
jgi:hypothetical protein